MSQERVAAFREEASRGGLAINSITRPTDGKIYFHLDLSQGWLYVPPDPARVLELVQLARRYASGEDSGEHNEILQLVVSRSELDKGGMMYCYRWYNVCEDASWISLGDWLAERGYAYVPTKRK